MRPGDRVQVKETGRRGRIVSMWQDRARFHEYRRLPKWNAIVEFRDHTRQVFKLDQLQEVKPGG